MSDEEKAKRIDHVLEQLVKKRSLSAICAEDEAAPSMSAFLAWVAKDATLAERYVRAREVQIIGLLEETMEIAESATDDAYITTDGAGRKVAKINGRAFKRAALMIEARERFAKMMLPERFAQQRMDVTSGGKALPAPVQANDNRLNALLLLAAQRAQRSGSGRSERGERVRLVNRSESRRSGC